MLTEKTQGFLEAGEATLASEKEEAFLEAVCQEIKWRAAWPGIREELADHVAEHVHELAEEGVPQEEAQAQALAAMGDAGAIGRSLNELHRPQLAKGLLALGVLLTAGGVVSILYAVAHGHFNQTVSTLVGVALGLLTAAIVYFSDYSRWLKWSPALYGIGAAILIAVDMAGMEINGRQLWLGTSMLRVNGYMLAELFFAAAVAGCLVLFRDKGVGGLLGCGILAALSVGLIMRGDFTIAIIMAFGYVGLFTQAIRWGYFGDQRRRNYAIVYGAVGAVWLAIAAYILPASWRVNRIVGMLHPFDNVNSSGWASSRAILTLQHAQFIGPADMSGFGETGLSYASILLEPMSNYALMRMVNDFGLLAGLLVVIGLLALVVEGFSRVRLVRNHYGQLLGMASLIFLGGQSFVSIMINLGFAGFDASLPFFTAGCSNMLASWLLLGILLAVWRRNTILVESRPASRKSVKQSESITHIIRWQEGCLIIDFGRWFGKNETVQQSEGGYDDGNR